MTASVTSHLETIKMGNQMFTAVIVIRNRKLFTVTLSRKYYPSLRIIKPEGIDKLKELLDDVYDELANRNLAGEIIETMGGK